jgi:hypothetical protein
MKTRFALVLFSLLAVVACKPQIGDPCFQAIDCSPDGTGGRICDVTSPEGYCTIINCTSDACPEEAACVAFRGGEQSFCMASCLTAEDCREGYDCLPEDEGLGVFFLDLNPRSDGATGFCGVPRD